MLFVLRSIFEKVSPKRIFSIKNLLLFGREIMRIIYPKIVYLLFVEAKKKFTAVSYFLNLPYNVFRVIFVF